MRLSSVLLPPPDGPVSATSSPGSRWSDTSASARIPPPSKLFRTFRTPTSAPLTRVSLDHRDRETADAGQVALGRGDRVPHALLAHRGRGEGVGPLRRDRLLPDAGPYDVGADLAHREAVEEHLDMDPACH